MRRRPRSASVCLRASDAALLDTQAAMPGQKGRKPAERGEQSTSWQRQAADSILRLLETDVPEDIPPKVKLRRGRREECSRATLTARSRRRTPERAASRGRIF